MRAIVSRTNASLNLCEARTANDLLVAFAPPRGVIIELFDVLELGNLVLDSVAQITNLTRSARFAVHIAGDDVHDMRIPIQYRRSSRPSADRLRDS